MVNRLIEDKFIRIQNAITKQLQCELEDSLTF